MGSLDHMDAVQNRIVSQGTSFMKHYAHVTLCCPSRVTLWTGRHAHNTNVADVGNNKPGGGWAQVQKVGLNDKYLPVWLQAEGYNTYYAGKLYNGHSKENYCTPKCAEGWTGAVRSARKQNAIEQTADIIQDFLVEPAVYTYYDSLFQHNRGDKHDEPRKVTSYSTDHITNFTLNSIDDAVKAKKPFFVVAAPIVPHISSNHFPNGTKIPFPTPKREYEHLYPHLKVSRTDNFNPKNVSSPFVPHVWSELLTMLRIQRSGVLSIWNLDKLTEENEEFLHEYYRHRQRALKSVDDMVDQVIQKLEDKGVMDTTYVIYSTDNGYHLGQHRLQAGKRQCFEEDINVPLVIRGPSIAKGQSSDRVSGHVDMAPTILNMAGAQLKSDWELDGKGITFPLETEQDLAKAKQGRGEHINLEFWGTFQQ
jgi:N-acetylglucosamine-6-sulfatase